jgi:uncharacterized protein (TIGR03503 family)
MEQDLTDKQCTAAAQQYTGFSQSFRMTGILFAALLSLLAPLGLIIALGVITPVNAWAETKAPANAQDIRLLIDISGSMKRTDPQNLRKPAINLLLDLLNPGSQAGVWTFGKEVNPLIPLGKVDAEWKARAASASNGIESVALFTNIGGVLEKASSLAPTSKPAHIILLTDGMVDIDKNPEVNAQEWQRIIQTLVPALKAQGFVVHTIALSEQADKELLQKIAESTGGLASVAESADELMETFLRALDAAQAAEQLPFSNKRFFVDSSVEEFTALIFSPTEKSTTTTGTHPLSLQSPDGGVITASEQRDDVAWHATPHYDVITVTRPFEGEWQVAGDISPRSRINVISNLSLRLKPLPHQISLGDSTTLEWALLDNQSIISDPAFLGLLQFDWQLIPKEAPDALQQGRLTGSQANAQGYYSATFTPNKTGLHRIQLDVDGKTFKRRIEQNLVVVTPFELTFTSGFNASSRVEFRLSVKVQTPKLQAATIQAVLTITAPDRSRQVVPLVLDSKGAWVYAFEPRIEGRYQLQVQLTGKWADGSAFTHSFEPYFADYNPSASFDALVEQASSSLASSAASLEAASSAPPAISSAAEASALDTPPPPEATTSLPSWALYAAIGLGNLLVLGLGIGIFRKLLKTPSPSTPNTANTQAAPPADEVPETAPALTPLFETSTQDEIPPMEDLEPDITFEEEAPKTEPAKAPSPPSADSFEFDLEALSTPGRSHLDEALQADDAELSSALLKAQGLDLPENELDDAISNLIDELDGPLDDKPSPQQATQRDINLDDFDFDEDPKDR